MRHVSLGCRFRDVVSGFEGICIARVEYLTGCDQLGLHPGMKDGKLGDATYFDVNRCVCVDPVPVRLPGESILPGGPQDAPGPQG